MALHKHPDLPHVPLPTDLPMSHEARQMFELVSVHGESSRPFVTPPDVPSAHIAALRQAFRKTMADPEFLAEATRSNVEIDPIFDDELAALVRRSLAMQPAAIARLKSVLAAKE